MPRQSSLTDRLAREFVFRILQLIVLSAGFCNHAFALNPDRHINEYAHRSWKIDDGYMESHAYAIVQDNDGYLWIGTNFGLFRFDGVRFVPWTPPAGEHLPSSSIFSLLADKDGTLWIGGSEGLSHWDHHHLVQYIEHEAIATSLFQDENGTIWFWRSSYKNDSSESLCKISNHATVCYGSKDGIPKSGLVVSMIRDRFGYLWMGTETSVISWKQGSSRIFSPESLRSNAMQAGVLSLVLEADDSLLVGIAKQGPGLGLQRLTHDKWEPVVVPGFDGSRYAIHALFRDKQNALWIGTHNEGIFRLFQGKVEHFGSQDGLSGDTVYRIFEDREGTLWVATDKGLDNFHDLPITVFSKEVNPKAAEFDNLVTLPDGTLWVGGEGALYTLQNGTSIFHPQGGDLSGKQVTTIFGDHTGRVWIGWDNTLNTLKDGRFTPINMPDGHPVGMVVSMTEDSEGSLWAVSAGPPRRILHIDPKTLQVSTMEHFPEAFKVASDLRGGLWLGLTNGDIAHYSKGKLETYPVKRGQQAIIFQLAVMPDGEVLVATGFGLVNWANGQVRVLDMNQGLPCNFVSASTSDANGNLWLYMPCGLVELKQSDFRRWQNDPATKVEPRVFDSNDGVHGATPPFEGAARSGDGKLWFNRMDALLMINPAHLSLNSIPPPVHIETVVADRHVYQPVDGLRLPPLTHDVEIDYTALSFVSPQKVKFRYRLTGMDQDWHDAGTRRQAFYMNLKPGRYTFQVIACNNDGIWNLNGDTLHFTIAPRFYQTIWFEICLAILGLLAIYGIFAVRFRISMRLVETRMNERLVERDRIARELHDTLLQGFQGIILRLQGVARMFPPQEAARQALEETMDRADEVLIEGRRSVLGLRSTAKASTSLVDELHRVIAELKSEGSIPCTLQVHGQVRPLKPNVQVELVAIAKEALTNAFRHSRASSIVAAIYFNRSELFLSCSDDGVGMPPVVLQAGSIEGHWGLVSIRERADKLRATLVFRGVEPHGTVVEVSVPGRLAYLQPETGSLRTLLGRFFRRDF